jgi:hypothetical protein
MILLVIKQYSIDSRMIDEMERIWKITYDLIEVLEGLRKTTTP